MTSAPSASSSASRPSDPSHDQRESQLIVFSDDWGRHPSSCQHLVRALLGRVPVTWINTIGMRPPRFDGETLRRGFEKLRHWGVRRKKDANSPAASDTGPAPQVVNPVMWPSFQRSWGRYLNRRFLGRALRNAIPKGSSTTILTTIPVVADLPPDFPNANWVYYCVDDFSTWPGLDGETMGRMERLLVERVDRIVAAGENLRDRIRDCGRDADVLPHGVDLDFWRMPDTSRDSLNVLRDLPRPLIMFWGLVDRRLDLSLLSALSQRLTNGSIVLVGPEQDADPVLSTLSGVYRVGPQPFGELPSLAKEASVLVMPYADLPVTRAMQPLKLKEYLATGKPVVVRQLPATDAWSDCMDSVGSPEEFVSQVLARLETGLPDDQRQARRRLEAEGWRAKADQLFGYLFPSSVSMT